MLICDEDNPTDVRKVPGAVEDDVADMVRYGLKSYLNARTDTPDDVVAAETYQKYQDPTARAMAMLRLNAEQEKHGRLVRRRGVKRAVIDRPYRHRNISSRSCFHRTFASGSQWMRSSGVNADTN
jgi:hypothetical protein